MFEDRNHGLRAAARSALCTLALICAPLAVIAGDETRIVLRGMAFDPVEKAANARASNPDALASRHGLVQFRDAAAIDRELLQAAGARIIEYVPHNAYLVRWDAAARARLAAHPSIRFAGDYEPEYRISPTLKAATGKAGPGRRLEILGFRGDEPRALAALVRKFSPGSTILSADSVGGVPLVRLILDPAGGPDDLARALASSDRVMWVDHHYPRRLANVDSVGPIQGNAPSGGNPPTVTPIWDQDLIGTGQIVAVADSGLDRNEPHFRQWNGNSEITDAEFLEADEVGTLYPQRKVVGYFVQPGASPYDDNANCGGNRTGFHGTHVTGTVAGDGGTPSSPTNPGYDDGDGMAPNAQILFQDIGDDSSGCLEGRGGYPMYLQARRAGAHITSGSYGAAPPTGSMNGYFSSDFEVDTAAYELEDLLLIFAAGNEGLGSGGVDHPGQAKAAVAAAALGHGSDAFGGDFSSHGPANDGRIKPDIAAPGTDVRSADGDDDDTSTSDPGMISTKSGTSMSTPTVAGGAALMRQYFTDGFYPTGVRTAANALRPSGALMKATLLNGTRTYVDTPAFDRGWGRIWLDNNLYFAGDDRQLRVWDRPNLAGLRTGEVDQFTVEVGAGQEFRATLVWFDPPAATFTGIALINDLDLEVDAGGTVYRGNQFTGGQSFSNNRRDERNPVEQVLLRAPTAGQYTITVRAESVPGNGIQNTDLQGYALVVSSAQCDTQVSGGTELDLAGGTDGIEVSFDSLPGANSYQIYRALGNCSTAPGEFKYVGQSSTTAFLDRRTQGGFDYAYRVRGADACGEGPLSTCKTVVSQAPCTLVPAFDAASVTVDTVGGNQCGAALAWEAGAATCPGATIHYNVYRSTDPFFIPAPGNLIASVAGTSYQDLAVDPLVTYYYAIKAEDDLDAGIGPNSGNESGQVRRHRVTTRADSSSPGDYSDDPDGLSFAALGDPWQVSRERASTGSYSYHNAPPGETYPDLSCAYLTTPPLNLQNGSPALSYDAWYDIEVNWDGVVVEISTDGGQTWQDLPPDGGYPSDFSETEIDGVPINQCGYPAVQGAFNGVRRQFQTYTSDLSAFAGQTVQLRWVFSSDPGLEFEGFYLDNIRITDASTPDQCLAGLGTGISGPWFNAAQSGHGWLVELLAGIGPSDPDRVNAYWYVYLNGLPVWLIGTGDVSGGGATLDVVMTAGPEFPPNYDPATIDLIPWGTLNFDFGGGTTGTASWDSLLPEFGSGSLDMVQLAPLSTTAASCRSGSYFSPAQNGHGFVVEVVNIGGQDQVILAWYVYLNGEQVWLFGQGPLIGDSAEVPMAVFSGADFPPNFDPADVAAPAWGTVTITFTGPDSADVSWDADTDAEAAGYSDGALSVIRLTELKGHACL